MIAKVVLAIMSGLLDTALIGTDVGDCTDSMIKNSTFGLDSGISSAADLTSSGLAGSNGTGMHLSAISSIEGQAPPVGELIRC